MNCILFLVAFLISTILPTYQVTYQQKQAYFKKLLHLKSIIDDKVQIIRKTSDKTLTNSKLLKGQPDLQKVILHQGIKTERNQLESALHETLIPLNQNYWSCKNLSISQKDMIAAKIKELKGKIDSIKMKIQGEHDCTRNVQFKSGLRFINLHIQSLQNQLSNICQQLKNDDKYNSNLVNAENFVGKVPNYNKKYLNCPSDKKYFNGAECQKCELPYFWNFDSNNCRECDKGLYFDKEARQCLYELSQQKYKTNIDATKNIFYNGNFEEMKREVTKSAKTACPANNPFFDRSTNECMNCSGESYIFNFAKDQCIKCSNGTHFNEESHICLQNEVKPTIERMVMNSVSWI